MLLLFFFSCSSSFFFTCSSLHSSFHAPPLPSSFYAPLPSFHAPIYFLMLLPSFFSCSSLPNFHAPLLFVLLIFLLLLCSSFHSFHAPPFSYSSSPFLFSCSSSSFLPCSPFNSFHATPFVLLFMLLPSFFFSYSSSSYFFYAPLPVSLTQSKIFTRLRQHLIPCSQKVTRNQNLRTDINHLLNTFTRYLHYRGKARQRGHNMKGPGLGTQLPSNPSESSRLMARLSSLFLPGRPLL